MTSNSKKERMVLFIAVYAIIWLSVSFTTCYGLYVTRSPWCLLALLLPVISLSGSNDSNEKSVSNEEIEKYNK